MAAVNTGRDVFFVYVYFIYPSLLSASAACVWCAQMFVLLVIEPQENTAPRQQIISCSTATYPFNALTLVYRSHKRNINC